MKESRFKTFSFLFFIYLHEIIAQKCSNANETVCSSDQCPGYLMVNNFCTATCIESLYFDK